jgi:hypothetical protein
MKFRIAFWDESSLMMEAARTSDTSVDNYFTRQYIPEDNSEQNKIPSEISSSDGEYEVHNCLLG